MAQARAFPLHGGQRRCHRLDLSCLKRQVGRGKVFAGWEKRLKGTEQEEVQKQHARHQQGDRYLSYMQTRCKPHAKLWLGPRHRLGERQEACTRCCHQQDRSFCSFVRRMVLPPANVTRRSGEGETQAADSTLMNRDP